LVWTTYKEKVKRLSQRIVDAQKPIRILDAIKWESSVEHELKKGKFKQMPRVGPEDYSKIDLGYDPRAKIDELNELVKDIATTLGADDSVGKLMKSITEGYVDVVRMIEARGTKEFWNVSRRLYGSPKDTLLDGKSTILQMGQLMYTILGGIDDSVLGPPYPEDHEAGDVVAELN
jgi:hypothetical protein